MSEDGQAVAALRTELEELKAEVLDERGAKLDAIAEVERLQVELAARGAPVADATTEALRDELRDRGWKVQLT
jgi:hypothetical protein